MVVTNLVPSKPQALSDNHIEALISACRRGVHPRELAKKLHPDDHNARRRAYGKLLRALLYDERAAVRIREEAQAELVVGLIPTAKALAKAAQLPYAKAMPSQKLLLEITGYHNPKVRREHSGEIKIKIDMPRPTFEQDEVVDATVVE
jgi:hypothetical protein